MADVSKLLPKILQWEGGYVNDPLDKGGATNMGITLKTWQAVGYDLDGDGVITAEDIKLLKPEHVQVVLKKNYWDFWKADTINNQSVAEILVDWLWASGPKTIRNVQMILDTVADGCVGTKTIAAINNWNQEKLHSRIKEARVEFVDAIIARDPSQKRFELGWKRRIASYNYVA
jgi:lysozyme family protein